MLRVAWVTPWERKCGIADYSKAIWAGVESAFRQQGAELLRVDQDPMPGLLNRIRAQKPDVVFFQHEYGLWGGKNPPLYSFPRFVRQLRQAMPSVKIGATAHTVLPSAYRFPTQGRGWQMPLRAGANVFLINRLRQVWGADTWGVLDLVVVHSGLQVQAIKDAGAQRVTVIPHYVPAVGVPGTVSRGSGASQWPLSQKQLLVFGFLSPEKGQDIAIQILSRLPADYRLILAGGIRRKADRNYEWRCKDLVHSLGLDQRVEWTGYVEPSLVDSYYARSHLVLAPFRETTGSGSLAQAFARGAAILASDLPLNQELARRATGCLEFFESGNAEDGARQVQRLFENQAPLQNLKLASKSYAQLCSVPHISQHYADEVIRLK